MHQPSGSAKSTTHLLRRVYYKDILGIYRENATENGQGLNIRIHILIPTKGRGLINQGSGLP